MTHTTNARIAGFTFLFYIVAGIISLVLFSQATGGGGITAKLASIAQHVLQVRMTIVLGLVQAVCAIVLAVTLYAITRDQDSDLATLAMIFRVGEGLLNAFSSRDSLELLWLGTYLLGGPDWNMSAILFAMGQHSLLLSVAAGPHNPCSTGVARRCCLGPSRGGSSSATRWILQGPAYVIHVDTHGRVRSAARLLAADQGC